MNLKKPILFACLVFILCLFSLSCSSSKKQFTISKKPVFTKIGTNSWEPHKDSIIVLSFYEILDEDTLRIEPVKFLNIDVLKQKIKISDLVWGYGFDGNVIMEFSLSPAGKAYNIRALTSNFGLEKSFEAALREFEFININFQISDPDYALVLLIGYCKLREFQPGPPPPIRITK